MVYNEDHTVIAIDPGLNGATVCYRPQTGEYCFVQHATIETSDSLIIARDYAEAVGWMWPTSVAADGVFVFMESVLVLSGQRGMNVAGINWGKISAYWELRGVNPLQVRSQDWHKMFVPKGVYKQMVKQASVYIATAMGFEIPTKRPGGRVRDDGVADALLIGLCGYATTMEFADPQKRQWTNYGG